MILDYGRVPGEDIGFVRRFLERRAGLANSSSSARTARDRRARALLGLPRARWLAWPPDLDQVGALLSAAPAGAASPAAEVPFERAEASDAPPPRRPRPTGRTGAAPDPPAAGGVGEPVDVGKLLEELLAGAALVGDTSPRYLYRCDETLLLYRERGPLAESLGALLELGRACAGDDGVVSVQADPAPEPGDPADTVRIRIDFPSGLLHSAEWLELLQAPAEPAETERSEGERELAQTVAEARRAADHLRGVGARVAVYRRPPDRLRLELHLASEALEAAAASPRRAKAEDPFA